LPLAQSRSGLLFVLVIFAHDRRRIVHVAVTEHSTAACTTQQLRNAFPENESPRYLLDSVFERGDHPGCDEHLGNSNGTAIAVAERSVMSLNFRRCVSLWTMARSERLVEHRRCLNTGRSRLYRLIDSHTLLLFD
jgi:hypothetical protein